MGSEACLVTFLGNLQTTDNAADDMIKYKFLIQNCGIIRNSKCVASHNDKLLNLPNVTKKNSGRMYQEDTKHLLPQVKWVLNSDEHQTCTMFAFRFLQTDTFSTNRVI